MNLLAALLLGLLAAPAQDAKTPRLHVEAAEIDFGTLFQGESLSRTFHVENRGDAPLVVDKVKPNCGCVAARVFQGKERREIGLDKSALIGGTPVFVLAPGEGADLEIVYDATGQPPRSMTKKILLGTNDPDRRQVTLVVHVAVKLALKVEPRPLQFGDVRRGTGAERDVLVQVADGLELMVTAVGNTDEVFSATFAEVESDEAGRRYRVRVAVDAAAPIGQYTRMLSILTDHPTLSRVNLPVQANVTSAVRFDTGNKIHDSILAFGWIPFGERTTRAIEIENLDPSVPYTLLGVDVDIDPRWKDGVTVEVEEVEAGRRYRVLVSAEAGLDTRFFRGSLVVRAEHPDEPTRTLQFNGRVTPEQRGG